MVGLTRWQPGWQPDGISHSVESVKERMDSSFEIRLRDQDMGVALRCYLEVSGAADCLLRPLLGHSGVSISIDSRRDSGYIEYRPRVQAFLARVYSIPAAICLYFGAFVRPYRMPLW